MKNLINSSLILLFVITFYNHKAFAIDPNYDAARKKICHSFLKDNNTLLSNLNKYKQYISNNPRAIGVICSAPHTNSSMFDILLDSRNFRGNATRLRAFNILFDFMAHDERKIILYEEIARQTYFLKKNDLDNWVHITDLIKVLKTKRPNQKNYNYMIDKVNNFTRGYEEYRENNYKRYIQETPTEKQLKMIRHAILEDNSKLDLYLDKYVSNFKNIDFTIGFKENPKRDFQLSKIPIYRFVRKMKLFKNNASPSRAFKIILDHTKVDSKHHVYKKLTELIYPTESSSTLVSEVNVNYPNDILNLKSYSYYNNFHKELESINKEAMNFIKEYEQEREKNLNLYKNLTPLKKHIKLICNSYLNNIESFEKNLSKYGGNLTKNFSKIRCQSRTLNSYDDYYDLFRIVLLSDKFKGNSTPTKAFNSLMNYLIKTKQEHIIYKYLFLDIHNRTVISLELRDKSERYGQQHLKEIYKTIKAFESKYKLAHPELIKKRLSKKEIEYLCFGIFNGSIDLNARLLKHGNSIKDVYYQIKCNTHKDYRGLHPLRILATRKILYNIADVNKVFNAFIDYFYDYRQYDFLLDLLTKRKEKVKTEDGKFIEMTLLEEYEYILKYRKWAYPTDKKTMQSIVDFIKEFVYDYNEDLLD